MESAKALLFDKKYGLGDNDIHVEWTFWFASVIIARSGKNHTDRSLRQNASSTAILNLIHRLGNAQPGSLDELVVLLIQTKLLTSILVGNRNVIDVRSEWVNATGFQFRVLTVLANTLIRDRELK